MTAKWSHCLLKHHLRKSDVVLLAKRRIAVELFSPANSARYATLDFITSTLSLHAYYGSLFSLDLKKEDLYDLAL